MHDKYHRCIVICMERGGTQPKTQADARHEYFSRHARIAKDLADAALAEIDEAMIENQINLAGAGVEQSLNGTEGVVGL